MDRIVSWASLGRTTRISYMLLLLIGVGLVVPGQLSDMMAALGEPGHVWGFVGFVLSIVLFAFLSWFWARAAVSARFDIPDTHAARDEVYQAAQQGQPPGQPDQQGQTRPRIAYWPLRIVPDLPVPLTGLIGLALAWRSGSYWLGVYVLALMLALWFLTIKRQAIRDKVRTWSGLPALDTGLPASDPALASTESFALWRQRVPIRLWKLMERAPFGPLMAIIVLAVSLLAFGVTAICSLVPAEQSDDLRNSIWTVYSGPTPVLIGCALMIGPLTTLVFVCDGWRPTRAIGGAPVGLKRPPVLLLLIVVSLLMPTILPSLHAVRLAPGTQFKAGNDPRQTLSERWAAWQKACGEGTTPILVAISGGASRAGLWGAVALAKIEETAKGTKAAIFSVSSVSGGSLGVAAYMSARAADSDRTQQPPDACHMSGTLLGDGSNSPFRSYADAIGTSDEVGPLLSGYVFSDVPRGLFGWIGRMFGYELRGGDRAAAIERAFESNARSASRSLQGGSGKPGEVVGLDRPFLELFLPPGMPIWIANGTERDTGERTLTIPLRYAAKNWPFHGASDLIGQLRADVPISTAINNTARFPYLEPSGDVLPSGGAERTISVLDGGYFDNSGLESTLELAYWLHQMNSDIKPIIVAVTGDGDGNGARNESADAWYAGTRAEDIVRCDSSEHSPEDPRPTATAATIRDPDASELDKLLARLGSPVEALAPVMGLYHARGGHVDVLLHESKEHFCPGKFFHFYLPALGTQNVPLNWVLSECMAKHIWTSLGYAPLDNCACSLPPGYPKDPKDDRFINLNNKEAEKLAVALRAPEP